MIMEILYYLILSFVGALFLILMSKVILSAFIRKNPDFYEKKERAEEEGLTEIMRENIKTEKDDKMKGGMK